MTALCALAIEAATDQLSIAASARGKSAGWEARPARDETQRIYEHAGRVLAEVGATLADLDFVTFGCGPGSFTGVRIAAAAAQAIAFARDIPLCRLSSLAVLAAGAGRVHGDGLYGVCLDARMERAYMALYRVGPGTAVISICSDALVNPGEFRFPGDESFVAVGPGWMAYSEMLTRHAPRAIEIDTTLLPSARDLLSMAVRDFAAGRTVDARAALPEYLGQGPGLAG